MHSSANTRTQEFLCEICDRNRAYYSDPRGRGALKELQQTFPNPWLYVAELLQNAIDEGATRVKVQIESDESLVLEHDGNLFTEKDVESISMKGVSSKGAGTIGFMGIGFKSVFRSFEEVEVASGEWRFRLCVPINAGERYGDRQREWLNAVLPVEDLAIVPPDTDMNCRFRLTKRLDGLSATKLDLERILGADSSLLALLAWRNVRELDWNGQHWQLAVTESQYSESIKRFELFAKTSTTVKKWVLFAKRYQPTDSAIAKFLEHRQLTPAENDRERVYAEASQERNVAIFCELDNDGDPIPLSRGSAFALLPTGITFPFGLHVQADWFLAVSRRELMQVEGNAWHEEIFAQLPQLVAAFLVWHTGTPRKLIGNWTRAYNIFVDEAVSSEIDGLFYSHSYLSSLADALRGVSFLPVPPSTDGMVEFVAPLNAQSLPDVMSDLFADSQADQRLLFGAAVVSTHLLGKKAMRALTRMGLLHELTLGDLSARWTSTTIADWLQAKKDDEQDKRLNQLHEALAKWAKAEELLASGIVCVPTESGGWIDLATAKRFPPDWDIVNRDIAIREALLPLLGDEQLLVKWTYDRFSQRNASAKFLSIIEAPSLQTTFENWWSSRPSELTANDVSITMEITNWVRTKQQQRFSLICKLLCETEGDNFVLVEPQRALIANPYAAEYRRRWLGNLPVISPRYSEIDDSAEPNDWRSFFEQLGCAGRIQLTRKLTACTRENAKNLITQNSELPELKVYAASDTWNGVQVDNKSYYLLDAMLPGFLESRFEHGKALSDHECDELADWMLNSLGELKGLTHQTVLFIPKGYSKLEKRTASTMSTWVKRLATASWISATNAVGPQSASNVLIQDDAARPNAPVAKTPGDLLNVLVSAGVRFGSAIPNAPAVERLKLIGPEASVEELSVLLEDAANEVLGDSDKTAFLKGVLSSICLFPAERGQSIDGKRRLPFSRIVQTTKRSLLNGWLTAVESFTEASPDRRALELAARICKPASETTFEQTVEFLKWVWQTGPDAEIVRRVLPRAYQYVRSDLGKQPLSIQGDWQILKSQARVFVQHKRTWHHLRDVYVDDLASDLIKVQLPDVLVATAGHLGDSLEDQLATGELLGIEPLSSRFRIATTPSGALPLPEHWKQAFEHIKSTLSRCIAASNDNSSIENTNNLISGLQISKWQSIHQELIDRDSAVSSTTLRATLDHLSLLVCGSSIDFAKDAAIVLCDRVGIRLRHDALEIAAELTFRFMQFDEPSLVATWNKAEVDVATEPTEPDSELEEPSEPANSITAAILGTVEKSTSEVPSAEPPGSGQASPRPESPSLGTSSSSHKKDISQTSAHQTSRGYSASDRESQAQSMRRRAEELLRQANELLVTGIAPQRNDQETSKTKGFGDDSKFRNAVLLYERKQGRIAALKDAREMGHDIDSFAKKQGLGKARFGKLLRRIEVKGKRGNWISDQIVELSDRQFMDAYAAKVEENIEVADDFDYWLYVVEETAAGTFEIFPIRNPARRASRFELRGGTWRDQAESPDTVQIGES